MMNRVTPSERSADRLLDDLNIRDLKDLQLLDQIAHARGAYIIEKDLKGMEARLTIVGQQAIIAVSTRIGNRQRRRFSIAHELGHLEIHPLETSFSFCTQVDINEGGTETHRAQREHEANLFASSFLMPRRFFAPQCQRVDPSLDLVSELASEFDTSLTATGLRYTQLCDEPVALVFSQDGKVRWFQGSREFQDLHLLIDVKGRLDPTTLAHTHFAGENPITKPRRVRCNAWFEDGKHDGDALIVEHSWPIPIQQAVLTLLWIDNEIIDEEAYHDWG